VVLLLKNELNSLPWCLLVCNLVVLLVVMGWTAAITGDSVGLFLDFSPGRKIWGNRFPGWKTHCNVLKKHILEQIFEQKFQSRKV
jgi:hypothetical protein